jgi:hypothetical protein
MRLLITDPTAIVADFADVTSLVSGGYPLPGTGAVPFAMKSSQPHEVLPP